MLTIHIASPCPIFRFDLCTAGRLSNPIARLSGSTGEGLSLEAVDQRINEAIAAITSLSRSETTVDVLMGQPLILLPNSRLALAQANSIGTARVCGLAMADASATFAASYSTDGVVERDNWTAVIGSVDLVPGAPYYLSPYELGKLTTIAPETVGQIVALAGFAISATKFAIEVQTPILL